MSGEGVMAAHPAQVFAGEGDRPDSAEVLAERQAILAQLGKHRERLHKLGGDADDAGLVEAFELRIEVHRLDGLIAVIGQGLHRVEPENQPS
ncbi:hypothetical protein [Croceicoccus naphthovorans]|uniref:Uncharacterized protein n=1 Tax=Croceicoccus naphthovorans TaxID=1348774 RepID=A0A0G3XE85_9SPHN|nr:hypothetical protein [Croceicoccus naphthovorans]AKM09860.1 hypothetical protein AB433_07475 [Croceicoccus naphthovorans]MBB3991312.1 hypothetical protein [Croceicoccus naphthovorans]